jgi:hypothetical protein
MCSERGRGRGKGRRLQLPEPWVCLGFGRIVVSEIEVPNLSVNLGASGCTVVQSDNGTEP